ncbi:FecR domain-containing protein [Pseudomonas lini]
MKLDTRYRRSLPAYVIAIVTTLSSAEAVHAQDKDIDATVDYVVRIKDTLYDLASNYLVDPGSWVVVQKLNHVREPKHLQPDSILRIPRALLKEVSLTARTIAVNGFVEHATGHGPFAPLHIDTNLAEGDRIRTGRGAFATVALEDGSHITLHSDSTVQFKNLRMVVLTGSVDRQIQLDQGEVETKVTPLKPDDRYNIISPSVVAGVRGTQFRVTYGDATTAIGVLEGKVAVQDSTQAPVLVPLQFGIVTDIHGQIGLPIALLPPPALSEPERLQDGQQLIFAVTPVAQAQSYHAAIATDAGFLNILREARTNTTQLIFDEALPAGNYFVRLGAIDRNGLEGVSQVYSFQRQKPFLINPTQTRQSTNFEFRWIDDPDVGQGTYSFVLAANSQMHDPLLEQHGLIGTRLVLSDLAPGKYYWTVVAHPPGDSHAGAKQIPVQVFTVSR